MPSGAGKGQCRVSVVSLFFCLTRFIDQLLHHFFGTLLLLLPFSVIYSEAQKSEQPSIIVGEEIIDNLELSCCWRGRKRAQF